MTYVHGRAYHTDSLSIFTEKYSRNLTYTFHIIALSNKIA